MTTTVFVFHPDLDQSVANKALVTAAKEKGVEVRDIYGLYPDGKINILAEQDALAATDRIVLQFPFYWYSSPSLLKEWLDQILEYGWAFGSQGTALHGKELMLAVTTGAKGEDYQATGVAKRTVEEFLLPFEGTSNLIGTTYLKPFVVTGVPYLTEQGLSDYVAAYQKRL